MNRPRNLKVDKEFQVLLDAKDENDVYAVNEEDKAKIAELYLKHKKLENIPEEHTVECYRVVKLRDNKNDEDWGIKDSKSTYKTEINKLKYPVIKIIN
jgi:hypothetical protein